MRVSRSPGQFWGGRDRLEAACDRALTHNTVSYASVQSILVTGLDKAATWRALADQDLGEALNRNEWPDLMLDREVTWRADKRFANRLMNAKMRFSNACIEDINFAAPPWP